MILNQFRGGVAPHATTFRTKGGWAYCLDSGREEVGCKAGDCRG